MILDQHWWHTADRTRLVPDGDPDAATLAYPRGHEVPDATCRSLGIPVPGDGAEDAATEPDVAALRRENEELRARVVELEELLTGPDVKAKPAPPNKARQPAGRQ